jgi:hypothetical protein
MPRTDRVRAAPAGRPAEAIARWGSRDGKASNTSMQSHAHLDIRVVAARVVAPQPRASRLPPLAARPPRRTPLGRRTGRKSHRASLLLEPLRDRPVICDPQVFACATSCAPHAPNRMRRARAGPCYRARERVGSHSCSPAGTSPKRRVSASTPIARRALKRVQPCPRAPWCTAHTLGTMPRADLTLRRMTLCEPPSLPLRRSYVTVT